MKTWNKIKNAALMRITANMPMRHIDRECGQPYMERYYVGRIGKLTFHLHRYKGGDGDQYLHNHPFNSVGIPLVGGYVEEIGAPMVMWNLSFYAFMHKVGLVNWIPADKWHRVASVEPMTWTLFIRGPRIQRWHFAKPGRWIRGIAYSRESDDRPRLLIGADFQLMPETSDHWWKTALSRNERLGALKRAEKTALSDALADTQ